MAEPVAPSPHWEGIEDAYGPADRIPALIGDLSAISAKTRADALHELWSRLCHQGTVYPASLAAVPMLARALLDCPDDGTRADLVLLLSGIGSAWTFAVSNSEPRTAYRLLSAAERNGVESVDLAEQCRRAVSRESSALLTLFGRGTRLSLALLVAAAAVGEHNAAFADVATNNVADVEDPRVHAAARLVTQLAHDSASITVFDVSEAAQTEPEVADYMESIIAWPVPVTAFEVAQELVLAAL